MKPDGLTLTFLSRYRRLQKSNILLIYNHYAIDKRVSYCTVSDAITVLCIFRYRQKNNQDRGRTKRFNRNYHDATHPNIELYAP